MKTLKSGSKVVLTLAATAALVAGGTQVAIADSGDGLEACSVYEICFTKDANSTRYQRHFYYGDTDHGGNHYYDLTLNSTTTTSLEDTADRIKNRDGSCHVDVIDWNGVLPSKHDDVPNNGVWTTLNDGVRNQNNEHKRCP